MEKYKQIHIGLWTDGFGLELTPEEKYFYTYLLTNINMMMKIEYLKKVKQNLKRKILLIFISAL